MSEPATARLPRRFSLRALLIFMLLVAALLSPGRCLWRQYVTYRDGQIYASLQDTKKEQVERARSKRRAGEVSAAIDGARPIPDDFAVLVRQGDKFGCFIPRNQFKKGESLEYDWYYRTDGEARFSAGSPKLVTGHSFAGPYVSGSGGLVKVAFGPFSIEWSGNGSSPTGTGWGFLYYDLNSPDAVGICTTDQRVVDYIDGKDPKWIYKTGGGEPANATEEEVANQ